MKSKQLNRRGFFDRRMHYICEITVVWMRNCLVITPGNKSTWNCCYWHRSIQFGGFISTVRIIFSSLIFVLNSFIYVICLLFRTYTAALLFVTSFQSISLVDWSCVLKYPYLDPKFRTYNQFSPLPESFIGATHRTPSFAFNLTARIPLSTLQKYVNVEPTQWKRSQIHE